MQESKEVRKFSCGGCDAVFGEEVLGMFDELYYILNIEVFCRKCATISKYSFMKQEIAARMQLASIVAQKEKENGT